MKLNYVIQFVGDMDHHEMSAKDVQFSMPPTK